MSVRSSAETFGLPTRFIPKLRNLDSCNPTLCGDDCIVNVSQIKHLDGRHKPAATPQVGRGLRDLVLAIASANTLETQRGASE
jgi:hypothetical protein